MIIRITDGRPDYFMNVEISYDTNGSFTAAVKEGHWESTIFWGTRATGVTIQDAFDKLIERLGI